jgi:hypothetical protein
VLAVLLLLLPFAVIPIGLLAVARSASQNDLERRRVWAQATLREAARLLDGELVPTVPGGSLMSVRAEVSDIRVVIDYYTLPRGRSRTQTYTRIHTAGSGPPGFALTVSERGAPLQRGEPLPGPRGLARFRVFPDDARFGERCEVKASDTVLAHAWLAPDVRSAITSALPFSHQLELGGLVTSRCLRAETDVQALLRGVTASLSLAGRGAALQADWQRLAQELQGMVATELWKEADARIEVVGATEVIVEVTRTAPAPLEGHLLTRVRSGRMATATDESSRYLLCQAAGALRGDDGANASGAAMRHSSSVSSWSPSRRRNRCLEALTLSA